MVRLIGFCCFCLLLFSACAENPPVLIVVPKPGDAAGQVETVPATEPSVPAQPNAALESLNEQIESAVAAREYERAVAVIERGLRIEPRAAGLWLKLATVRFSQERYQDALVFATRAERLASGDADMHARCRSMIQRAQARLARIPRQDRE